MQEMNPFIRDDVLPSWWGNAIQKALSNFTANFTIEKEDAVTIRVPAGPDEDASIVTVQGKWRWVEANVTRAHPGGAAGEYVIWTVAEDNNIVNVPLPGTDETDYAFELRITDGTDPAGVALFQEAGRLYWDGAEIDSIYGTRNTYTMPSEGDWPVPANYVELRTIDARDVTLHELADYVSTLEERVLRDLLRVVTT